MRSNSIDRIIVGNNNPHNNNTLWVDTSNGEKKAVLKYKGNPLVGGSSGGSGSDYQSSSSIVKDMVEQGSNFNWGKYAIDIPSLPCFKPEAEWPWKKVAGGTAVIADILAEGYTAVNGFIVRVTGENPSVAGGSSPEFEDCEPVVISESKITSYSFEGLTFVDRLPLTPIRSIHLDSSGCVSNFDENLGVTTPSVGSDIEAVVYPKMDGESAVLTTVVAILSAGEDS